MIRSVGRIELSNNVRHPWVHQLRTIADRFRPVPGGEGEPEQIVVKGVTFENAGQWLEKFARLRRAISYFEPATVSLKGFGSAFLIAPDMIKDRCTSTTKVWIR